MLAHGKAKDVDFIEQWLHIAPDAGNGTLEAIYLVTGAAVATLLIFGRRIVSNLMSRRAASRRP